MRKEKESTDQIDGSAASDAGGRESEGESSGRLSVLDYEFDVNSDKWKLSARSNLNAAALRNAFPGVLTDGAMGTMAHYAQVVSAGTCAQFSLGMRRLAKFVRTLDTDPEITTTMLINFRHHAFQETGNDQIFISSVRPFLRKWYDLGFDGVSEDVIDLIESWTLRSAPAGEAVNRQGADDGPLERDEKATLEAGWMAAYEAGSIDHGAMSLCLLLSRSGRRPSQYANIKLVDLYDRKFDDLPNGDSTSPRRMLLVHIPRAKQPDQGWRKEFRTIEVIPAIWNSLVRQRMLVMQRFEEMIVGKNFDLAPHEILHIEEQLPLWPLWSAVSTSLKVAERLLKQKSPREAIDRLRLDGSSDAWHQSASAIGNLVKEASAKTDSKNRNSQPLHVNPRRFRYTLGTELVRKGVPATVAAHLMDHSSLDSLKIYEKSIPDHAIPINKAMALSMKPLVRMFSGEAVDRELDARGGDRPHQTRILFNGRGTATCGIDRQCGLNQIPRCCYTCNHFQPWLEGPHEPLLEVLLDERQQRFELLGPSEMVGVNDLTIYAVVEVIQRCQLRRQELAAKSAPSTQRKNATKRHASGEGSGATKDS